MTPESLGRLKRAYATAQIIKRDGDEYSITGIEENLLSVFGQIIPDKSLAVRQVETQPQQATPQEAPAQSQSAGSPNATQNDASDKPADPPNTDIVQAMSKFVDQIAIAKSNEATKSVIEKYDKLETAEKLLVQRISSAETEIDGLKDKMAILETAWQDERARNELRAASNAEEHKKAAENVASITQHLKNIPLPK